jgi:hypothetical protein
VFLDLENLNVNYLLMTKIDTNQKIIEEKAMQDSLRNKTKDILSNIRSFTRHKKMYWQYKLNVDTAMLAIPKSRCSSRFTEALLPSPFLPWNGASCIEVFHCWMINSVIIKMYIGGRDQVEINDCDSFKI